MSGRTSLRTGTLDVGVAPAGARFAHIIALKCFRMNWIGEESSLRLLEYGSCLGIFLAESTRNPS